MPPAPYGSGGSEGGGGGARQLPLQARADWGLGRWEDQPGLAVRARPVPAGTLRPPSGSSSRSKTLEIEGKEIKAQIWDTSGQERYRAVTSVYYRGAVGALLAHDISRRSSFDNVSQWLREVRE